MALQCQFIYIYIIFNYIYINLGPGDQRANVAGSLRFNTMMLLHNVLA